MSRATYGEAVARLLALAPRGIELGTERVEATLRRLGDPHRRYRVVHVAGTNGKGSVAATCASVLRAAGHRVGLYTSPHLHRVVERIVVDGRPMPEAAFARAASRLLARDDLPPLTFFEAVTVLAFERFADAGVDVAVVEVGLGGRLDATNVVRADVSVVTQVSRDHEEYLGSALEGIATEKLGIVRRGARVVHGLVAPDVPAEVESHARRLLGERRARAWALDHELRLAVDARGGLTLETPLGPTPRVRSPLAGPHQARNVALALAACVRLREAGLDVPDDALVRGVRATRWPGRFESLPGRPRMRVDGAHNEAGCVALAAALGRTPRPPRRVLVFAGMRDKHLEPMLAQLAGSFDAVVCTTVGLPRSEAPAAVADYARAAGSRRVSTRASAHAALAHAEALAGEDGEVVVAGSLFLVAAARALRLRLREDPRVAL